MSFATGLLNVRDRAIIRTALRLRLGIVQGSKSACFYCSPRRKLGLMAIFRTIENLSTHGPPPTI